MSRPNNIKKIFLQYCADKGEDLETLREARAVSLLGSFYEEISFDGRRRGTSDDKLRLDTLNTLSDDRWTVRLARQLYKHGRGIRLSLLWTYDIPSFLSNISVESDAEGSAAWVAEALKEVASLEVDKKKPASFEITLDSI